MTKQNYFNKRLINIPTNVISLLTAIDELKGRWGAGVTLHPHVLSRLKQSVLITSTGASTRIEGSQLSDEDIESLMRGIKLQKFKDRDSQEAKSYYELLKNIFNSWQTIKLSESTIKHFHKELLKHVEKDAFHRGEYEAYLTPIEMRDLVEWTTKELNNKHYHPLLIIGNFIIEFLKIHPFKDGNGRVSRILTNLLLLQAGYLFIPYISHEKIIEDNKSKYYLALRKTQKTFKSKSEEIISWLNFFLDTLLTQSKMALDLLYSENIEKILSKKQLLVWEYLQKVKDSGPLEISEKTSVAHATVKQALQKILQLKKIERIGMGRSTRYRVIK